MPGKQALQVTGQLGDVMKESAHIALSYLRAHADEFEIDPEKFANREIHIHVPEGATPKDGPSAGVTLATSLASLFSGIPVRNDLCMTGEITLRGNVLPVGGIREKIVAANRYEMKHIILPAANEKDLYYVPQYIRKDMTFHFVKTISDVLALALITKPNQVERTRARA
jgi:ATP-dependent Lon protease